ncbi:MAG: glycosyltransferase [Bacteroidales bacterium]|nr:glycosyltransferase [Bacteroidales bacterium]MCM1146662.1 glycosyltransferase [Bacteroidales bacterium]MCM1206053.1 glycosyltransferase [Bacillota bacterium]MCM1511045.1 glycosyltransferase [Clostridium sp.]
MTLSILIPTYNRDCTELVETLREQLPEDAEIIVGNDRSTCEDTVKACRRIASMSKCRVYEPEKNLGRSRIRNRLFSLSSGKWILFIDSDTRIDSPDFIKRYLDATAETPADMYYGGMKNTPDCPPGCELRWTYETVASRRLTLSFRRDHPYDSLTTQNFMISRDAFMQTGFLEEITSYGYEDTVLFATLKNTGKRVCHIENRLIHLDIDTNERFLTRTREALRTLHSLPEDIRPETRLVQTFRKLRRMHMHRPLALLHHAMLPVTHRILYSRFVSLKLFQLYKLGYFCGL